MTACGCGSFAAELLGIGVDATFRCIGVVLIGWVLGVLWAKALGIGVGLDSGSRGREFSPRYLAFECPGLCAWCCNVAVNRIPVL